MAAVTQVAFELDNEILRRIDELAAARSCSRAEVLRDAHRPVKTTARQPPIC